MKAFLIGFVALFPVALIGGWAALMALNDEADTRAAKNLMRQIRPGIVECAHVERDVMNCKYVKRGKPKTVVLAAKE